MFGVIFYLSSVNAFSLGKPKILLSSKGLKLCLQGYFGVKMGFMQLEKASFKICLVQSGHVDLFKNSITKSVTKKQMNKCMAEI